MLLKIILIIVLVSILLSLWELYQVIKNKRATANEARESLKKRRVVYDSSFSSEESSSKS